MPRRYQWVVIESVRARDFRQKGQRIKDARGYARAFVDLLVAELAKRNVRAVINERRKGNELRVLARVTEERAQRVHVEIAQEAPVYAYLRSCWHSRRVDVKRAQAVRFEQHHREMTDARIRQREASHHSDS